MFSKNIKKLSLFLILAVVMIGAVSAVSATDVGGTQQSSGTVTDVTVTGNGTATTTNAGSSSLIIEGTVSTTNAQISSDANKYTVPAGTVVNATYKSDKLDSDKPTISIDSAIYKADKTTTSGATIPTGTSLTIDAKGQYSTSTALAISGANNLVNGNTYYLKLTVDANAAAYVIDGTNYNYTYLSAASPAHYIAFTYNAPTIALDNNATTITYGDGWSFTGTLTDATGKAIPNSDIKVTINPKSGTSLGEVTVKTDDNGNFKVTNTTWASAPYTPIKAAADNYTVTFTYGTTVATSTANLNVTQKKANINTVINTTNASFGDTISFNATVVDVNGNNLNNSDVTLTTSIINQDGITVSPTWGTDLAVNDKGIYTIIIPTNTVPGTYYITLTGTSTDNNIVVNKSNTVKLTINPIATNLVATPEIVNTTITDLASTGNPIEIISNNTKGNLKVTGIWTAILYKQDGTPINTITLSNAYEQKISNAQIKTALGDNAEGNYYIVFTYTPNVPGYTASNTTVNLVIKQANKISNNFTDAIGGSKDLVYNVSTTGNSTYVNITSNPVQNTTVTIMVGNQSLGTAKIIDGSAIVDFGSLKLSAGTYVVKFVYAGDDTYLPSNSTMNLIVKGVNIGNLTANPDTINDLNINSVNKTINFNLTNATNASQIIDYTGDVKYTTTNNMGKTTNGTISMVNGKATIDATTLKGLYNGKNTIVFAIDNNKTSTTATVVVYATTLTTGIIANNISTNNATPITITGTVTNATEGNVIVYLKNNKNITIATTTGTVNADGTFTVAFGNYANGNYTAEINYTSNTGLSSAATTNITVTVNGTTPAPVTGNITTIITVDNFTEYYGQALNLTGKLTDVNGNPLVGQTVAINLTRLSDGASKIYNRNTDVNGEYQIPIELFAGNYSVSVSFAGYTTKDNATTYLASGPASENFTVTAAPEPSDNRTATVLSFSNFTEKYGQALNFTGKLTTADGTPIVGQKVAIVLSNAAGQSKLYWGTTDVEGLTQLPIELFAGDYTFKCSYAGDNSTYKASNIQEGSITVTA